MNAFAEPGRLYFFFDYISHNAYLAWHKAPVIAARHGLTLTPVPVLFGAMLSHYRQIGPAELPAKSRWMLTNVLRKAKIHGIPYEEIAIKPMFDAFRASLAPSFEGKAEDHTEENLQSRIRGTLLMALSNKFGSIVVTTGNKSEMATGYATLYGDMAGGFAVIKDIVKTLVYRISNWRNSKGRVIPQRVIDRAPSAELKPGQTDQDTLPPYEVLDAVVERYMERDMTPEAIAGLGYDLDAVRQVVRLIRVNEYKRRQAPPGVRITPRSFGKDWRYPITSGFRPKA